MDREEQKELLQRAVAAAAAGLPAEYFTALAASHALDGLVGKMRKRWPRMDEDTVHHAVAEAVDSLLVKLSGGGVVSSPLAYLFKAAFNQLAKTHEARQLEVAYDDEDKDYATDDRAPQRDREALRSEALRFARSLLPRLGEQNIQRVMGFILECVERGEFHVDNELISEATGLSLLSVRRLKSRGFQRLRREAEREGIELGEHFEANDEEPEAEHS
ncbi:RNA polymerase sigma factor [Pyxidicoccus sp. 3LG]